VASISARFFFQFVAELFRIEFLVFGDCEARFLVTQSSFFKQPPATRIGVPGAVGFFKKFLDERRRVDPDFLGRFVIGLFKLLLICF
jgi:hypothetical protein